MLYLCLVLGTTSNNNKCNSGIVIASGIVMSDLYLAVFANISVILALVLLLKAFKKVHINLS